jgi:aminoglycoside 3-N-acetyltransferase
VLDATDFEEVGAAVSAAGLEVEGPVGRGSARLVPVRPLVDFATAWFVEHRTAPDGRGPH